MAGGRACQSAQAGTAQHVPGSGFALVEAERVAHQRGGPGRSRRS
ncbi:hypothetical protein [Streptosporangium saharense]